MIYKDACMSDVLSIGTQRDSCVVLPTLNHAAYWWPRIHDMFADRQRVMRVKTGLVLQQSHMIIRLWVPYNLDPTAPMDFEHDFVYYCDYLLLWGLSKKGDVKWR